MSHDEWTVTASTRRSDPWWVRLYSTSTLVLVGLTVVISASAVWAVSTAAPDTAKAATWILLLSPIPATTWSVVESLWRRDTEWGILRGALARTFAMPALTLLVITLGNLGVALLPGLRREFTEQPWPEHDWSGLFPDQGSTLLGWLGLNAAGSAVLAMLAGLAAAVYVVSPVTAALAPRQYIRDNGMSLIESHREGNTVAVRALAALLCLVFIAAALLTWPSTGSPAWWGGVLVLAAIAALGVVVARSQRR